MASMDLNTIISFLFYLVFMLLIGVYFYNKTRNLSDYILGGRKLGPWVSAMSAQASDMSGWLLLGLPGYAYATGLEAAWIAIGLALGTYINWKFIARRLRVFTKSFNDAITLPDYFENRFNDPSKVLRIISALFILIFFLIYTASGFVAGAKLFNTVFGISYQSALFIGVLVIISYTFLGGFMAVSWTDFFQGTLMLLAILILPFIGLNLLGGFSATTETISKANPELLNMFTQANGKAISLISILSLLGWGLGYFGQPHILARFMAISKPKAVKKARLIAMTWVTLSLGGAILSGMIGFAFLNTPIGEGLIQNMTPAFEKERIFMVLVNALVHPAIAGLLLSAILAAIMSTADSQLLVTSSALTEDFYSVLLRRKASDKELVWVSRFSVIAVALIAYGIARNPDSSVLDLVSYAWAGFGATFGPLIIFSLFYKGMTRASAIAAILTGGITVIVFKQLSGGFFDLYEIIPGFALSSITIVLVSRLGALKDASVAKQFKKALQKL